MLHTVLILAIFFGSTVAQDDVHQFRSNWQLTNHALSYARRIAQQYGEGENIQHHQRYRDVDAYLGRFQTEIDNRANNNNLAEGEEPLPTNPAALFYNGWLGAVRNLMSLLITDAQRFIRNQDPNYANIKKNLIRQITRQVLQAILNNQNILEDQRDQNDPIYKAIRQVGSAFPAPQH